LNIGHDSLSERALILAPQGRDAFVAARILGEARLVSEICDDLPRLLRELTLGAGLAVLTEESIRSADINGLANWTGSQPPWSDFPFVVLTERGAGVERNPAAERQNGSIGKRQLPGATVSPDHADQRRENGPARTTTAI
jgi:hypothetical protein